MARPMSFRPCRSLDRHQQLAGRQGGADMRQLIVLSFITLDGVMQAPGGPGEDDSGGFKYGGWSVPYFDEALGNVMGEQMGHPVDLLLGRTTFDIFAAHWPLLGGDDPAAGV